MAAKAINITWTEAVTNYLVEKGYSVNYGARNLRRLIQKEIEDPAAEQIISFSGENPGMQVSEISLSVEDGKISIEIK